MMVSGERSERRAWSNASTSLGFLVNTASLTQCSATRSFPITIKIIYIYIYVDFDIRSEGNEATSFGLFQGALSEGGGIEGIELSECRTAILIGESLITALQNLLHLHFRGGGGGRERRRARGRKRSTEVLRARRAFTAALRASRATWPRNCSISATPSDTFTALFHFNCTNSKG